VNLEVARVNVRFKAHCAAMATAVIGFHCFARSLQLSLKDFRMVFKGGSQLCANSGISLRKIIELSL
jgi:hypothetical protein